MALACETLPYLWFNVSTETSVGHVAEMVGEVTPIGWRALTAAIALTNRYSTIILVKYIVFHRWLTCLKKRKNLLT